MKQLFYVVKRILCDCVHCTKKIENMLKCLKKSALLMICCDVSTKSFENVPIACENCTKAN